MESGVGYVKKNFLNGLQVADFAAIGPAAQLWLDGTANVRQHGETQCRPIDLLAQDRAHLKPLNSNAFDIARTLNSQATSQFRVLVDTNHYSVPPEYAHRRLTTKVYPDRLCVYFDQVLIARHVRRYDHHADFEDPDHVKALLAQRHRAREQRLLNNFHALSADAPAYYAGLEQRRGNPRHHARKILALAEIYPRDEVSRAITDGLAFEAFSAEYITNILEARARRLPEPGPLQLTRRHDLLDLEIADPDLSPYEIDDDEPQR